MSQTTRHTCWQGTLDWWRQDRHALTCPLQAPLPSRLVHGGQDRGLPALVTPRPRTRALAIVHISDALSLGEGCCS